MVALVDDADYKLVSQFKWRAWRGSPRAKTYYAITGNHPNLVWMHRLILDCPHEKDVDHKNGQGLDNQRHNLRLCSQEQNTYNRPQKPGKSGYRGVYFMGDSYRSKPWRAQVGNDQRRTATFATAKEAAQHYDKLAKELYGEFAILNFPNT